MKGIKILMTRKSLAARLTNQTVTGSAGNPAVATAKYFVKADGNTYKQLNVGSVTLLEQWMLTGPNSNFVVFAHVNSGTAPTGSALDTELALTSDQAWQLSQSTIGTKTCQLAVQIRDAVTHAVLASNVVTITADDT